MLLLSRGKRMRDRERQSVRARDRETELERKKMFDAAVFMFFFQGPITKAKFAVYF